jgi:hypothetical protein
MLPVTALFTRALPFPHRVETRVQVYHGTTLMADSDTMPDLLPVAGEVTASVTSRVTRNLTLTVAPSLYPFTATSLLSPEVAVLRVFSGIGYPNGSREIFPVFTGRVQDVRRGADGGVQIEADDLARDVIDFEFENPQPSVAGALVTAQIRTLITQALPTATFGTDDANAATTPTVVWDQDRGQALDDLAFAAGGRWYALGDGSFVTRRYPYQQTVPVVTIADESGGTNMTAERFVTRDGVANSITVSSERMDGSPPIRATVRDTNPASPTFFGGTFGRKTRIIKVQTPLTSAEAQAMATAELAASIALGAQWSISCVPNHALEPGDCILVKYRGISEVQIIDDVTYPLTDDNAQRIGSRSPQVLGSGGLDT